MGMCRVCSPIDPQPRTYPLEEIHQPHTACVIATLQLILFLPTRHLFVSFSPFGYDRILLPSKFTVRYAGGREPPRMSNGHKLNFEVMNNAAR